jgi:CTP:molybdopterin cytidylyltransferase MocA
MPLSDIFAVILAAGAGRRMGRPKALVELGPTTFLERVLATARRAGVQRLAVVVAEAEAEILRRHDLTGVKVLHNPDPSAGPISSIRVALADPEIAAADAILVHPVDHPLVRSGTLRRLTAAFQAGGAAIVVPCVDGRGGHPTLFGRSVFRELLTGPEAEGARRVVRHDPSRVLRLEVDDPGVRENLNTPEDLPETD